MWVGTRAALTLGTGRTIRIAGRKVGVLQTIQKTKRNRIRNDRVIAVPKDSHRERELQGVEDLPSEVKEELEKFFVATDELEAKTLKFLGWQGPAQAKKRRPICRDRERLQRSRMSGCVPKPVILQLLLNVRARVERPPDDDAQQDR